MKRHETLRRATQVVGLLGITLFLTNCSSCTDDPAGNGMTTPENNRTQQPPGKPPVGSKLIHVDPDCVMLTVCTDDVTFSGGRKLQVMLIDGNGQPSNNVNIKFAIKEDSDAEGTNLTSANKATNAEGIAETDLRAGTDSGTVRVVVSTDDPNVNTLEFLVSVNPKDAAGFNVNFTEVGDTDIKRVEVFLFEENVSCDQFLNNRRSITAQNSDEGEASANGDLPTIAFSGVPNGTTYTVGAVAYDRTNAEVEVAAGCAPGAMNPRVTNGMAATVTVPLLKHIPYMVGDYSVIHTFNLVNAFPPNVKRIVNLLGTLVSDPGAFIVGCGKENPNTGELEPTDKCPVPTEGIANLLVDFLPDDGALGQLKDSIEGFLDSSFSRAVVQQVINDAVGDFIQNNSSIPSWVKDGLNITEDIYASLREFRVEATMRIKEQPVYVLDANGLPMDDGTGGLLAVWENDVNEHVWQDIILHWSYGCPADAPPECGSFVKLDPNDVSTTDAVQGVWGGTVIDGNKLIINEHSLSFNYGSFVLQLLERLVFPQIFGDPTVNSVEAGLDKLVNCETLATQVADATIDSLEGIFKSLCTQLKGQATDALRGYVAGLVIEGSDRFVIGSPDGQPCQIAGPDQYVPEWTELGFPLPYVEKFGKQTAQCNWNVKIKFSESGEALNMPGTFYGGRK